MNQTSFETGDRVRHKVTQIEGEIVQTEESLAMPHAWVIEPSVCEFNPPRLYRIVDLEKVEDSGEGAQKTNQAQGVNPNISPGNHWAGVDSSTLKEFPSDKSDREPVLTAKPTINNPRGDLRDCLQVEKDTTTVNPIEKDTTTVSTVESFVLIVEPELVTLCSESVSGEEIASKPLPISVRNLSNTVGNTSTSNELPCQRVLTVEEETTTVSTKVEFSVLTVENGTTEGVSDETTQRINKRRKGEGTGRIQLRTITKKNGKQYQQFWYDWQVHTKEKIIYKSVYIPKRLLEKIQALESAKTPVLEILEVLGVFRK